MKDFHNKRLLLLFWIIVPLMGVWLAVNYLLGTAKHPAWDKNQSNCPQTKRGEENNLQKIPKIKWKGEGLVTLWFDDAWSTQYTVAFPILEEKGFVAALAVISNFTDGEEYMSWAQIRRLQYKGWEITSHTRNHLCEEMILNPEIAEQEIKNGKEDLENQKLNADQFVMPCGLDSPIINQTARKYFVSLRTSGMGLNKLPVENPYNLLSVVINSSTTLEEIKNWLSKAKKERRWLILTFHRIDEGKTKYSISQAKFREILQLVQDSQFRVVLPSQALEISLNQD